MRNCRRHDINFSGCFIHISVRYSVSLVRFAKLPKRVWFHCVAECAPADINFSLLGVETAQNIIIKSVFSSRSMIKYLINIFSEKITRFFIIIAYAVHMSAVCSTFMQVGYSVVFVVIKTPIRSFWARNGKIITAILVFFISLPSIDTNACYSLIQSLSDSYTALLLRLFVPFLPVSIFPDIFC